MCDPVSIALVAVAVVGGISDRNQAKAEEKFAKQISSRGQGIAETEAARSQSLLDQRRNQAAESAAVQIANISRAARSQAASVAAEAGSKGTAGASVLAAVDAVERRELEAVGAVDRSLTFTEDQIEASKERVQSDLYLQRLNNAQGPSRVPSLFEIALKAGASALSSGLSAGG